jgi:hypothetical protein
MQVLADIILPVIGWASVGWVVASTFQTRYRLNRLEAQAPSGPGE